MNTLRLLSTFGLAVALAACGGESTPPTPAPDGGVAQDVASDPGTTPGEDAPDAGTIDDPGTEPDPGIEPDTAPPPDVTPECVTDSECVGKVGDIAPCVHAACVGSLCVVRADDDGATCDDGDPCTTTDTCASGSCGGLLDACDDGNGCTLDHCVGGVGCTHESTAATCDDGDPCTEADHCAASACVGLAIPGCGKDICGDTVCGGTETCASCAWDCSPIGLGACGAACDPTVGPTTCGANFACVTKAPVFGLDNGVCAKGCAAAADCAGGDCVLVAGLGKAGICAAACDPAVAYACGPFATCVPKTGGKGVCVTGGVCDPSKDGGCVAATGLVSKGLSLLGCDAGSGACGIGLPCLAKSSPELHAGVCVGQAAACSAKTQTGCADGETCVVVAGSGVSGAAYVCQPALGATAALGPCSSDAECAPKLTCFDGACRAACDPAVPSCASGVCNDLSGGYGLPAKSVGACAPGCGDGACSASETCGSCPTDCGDCDVCGDDACSGLESCGTCPGDCGLCPGCGNGLCEPGETCSGCAQDCGACAVCGDAFCSPTEDCESCSGDCGSCLGVCGDAVCSPWESCLGCTADCGTCALACGDGECAFSEDCESCPSDCGACPFTCGNGVCEKGEACATCHADCALLGLPECGGACDPTKGATCPANFVCVPTSGGKTLAAAFELGNGICASGCFLDAECPDGACLHVLGLDVPGVCGAACTPGSALCPSGQACVAKGAEPTKGVCVAGGLCDPSADSCGAGAPGESCIARGGAPDIGICVASCYMQGPASCLVGSCHAKKDAGWHTGTCAGTTVACDVAKQTGCAAGETCQAVGGGAMGGGAIACVKFGGNASVGQSCAEAPCSPGLLCHQGTCRAPCAPVVPCAAGLCTDVGGSYGFDANQVRLCL